MNRNRSRNRKRPNRSNVRTGKKNVQSNKPIVYIYVNGIKDKNGNFSEVTKYITDWVARRYNMIESRVRIKFVRIGRDNMSYIKKLGVTKAPTLLFNDRKFVGLESVKSFLGSLFTKYSVKPDDDNLLFDYQMNLLQEDPDENEDNETRGNQIRKNMERFQKRRPKMEGDGVTGRLSGGTKSKSKSKNIKFDEEDDDKFIEMSGVDNGDNFDFDDIEMEEWDDVYKANAMADWYN